MTMADCLRWMDMMDAAEWLTLVPTQVSDAEERLAEHLTWLYAEEDRAAAMCN